MTHVESEKEENWEDIVVRATATMVVSRKLKKRPVKTEVRMIERRQPDSPGCIVGGLLKVLEVWVGRVAIIPNDNCFKRSALGVCIVNLFG